MLHQALQEALPISIKLHEITGITTYRPIRLFRRHYQKKSVERAGDFSLDKILGKWEAVIDPGTPAAAETGD